MAATKNMDLIASQNLDLAPSCVEFVPGADSHFIVGTYNLQNTSQNLDDSTSKALQTRNGSLILFRIEDHRKLTLVETQPYPSAIPDLHFCPASTDTPLFAVASSTGAISIYDLSPTHHMRHISTHQILSEDTLILSLAWYPNLEISHLPLLLITTSKGGVYILRFTSWEFIAYEILNQNEPIVEHELMNDPIEAWTSAFSPSTPTIYSGGDDSTLRTTTLNTLPLVSPNFIITSKTSNSRHHEAGVTAILPLPGTNLLLTGSYDEHIRLFGSDVRKAPKAELKIEGGGVWRLKMMDEGRKEGGGIRYRILASCMHAGARIIELRISDNECEFKVVASVTIHKSMCYACDVQPATRSGEIPRERLIVSISFYDKLLCVWNYDSEAEVE